MRVLTRNGNFCHTKEEFLERVNEIPAGTAPCRATLDLFFCFVLRIFISLMRFMLVEK